MLTGHPFMTSTWREDGEFKKGLNVVDGSGYFKGG